tara:strand:- start:91 stop:636 length:546 start_codon:yes stop_codon:yes gene_type:complete
MSKLLKIIVFILIVPLTLSSCKGPDGKWKFGADPRKNPADPAERVKKNLEEGKGFRLKDGFKNTRGGVFEFASSNPMWRASLDIIEFMPLSSVNYSGGIIITDWYSENNSPNESIKISIRFLTNEIRADALDIKVFNRKCENNLLNCKFIDSSGVLVTELKKEILKKAAIYKKEENEKKKN